MTNVAVASERILNSRLGTLVARSRFVLGVLAAAIFVLTLLSWFHRSHADEAYADQLTLNQISLLTRQLHTLKLVALQKQDLSPAAETDRRKARQSLRETALAAQLHSHHTAALEEVWPAFDSYTTASDRQFLLMAVGNFDDAKQAEFQTVGPEFD